MASYHFGRQAYPYLLLPSFAGPMSRPDGLTPSERLHPKYKLWFKMEDSLLDDFIQFYNTRENATNPVHTTTMALRTQAMTRSDKVWLLRDIESVGGAISMLEYFHLLRYVQRRRHSTAYAKIP